MLHCDGQLKTQLERRKGVYLTRIVTSRHFAMGSGFGPRLSLDTLVGGVLVAGLVLSGESSFGSVVLSTSPIVMISRRKIQGEKNQV